MICPVVEWELIGSDDVGNVYYMDKEGAGIISEGIKNIWLEKKFSKEGLEKEIKELLNKKTDSLVVIDYDTIKIAQSARMLYRIDYTDKTKVEFILKFISYHDKDGNTLYSQADIEDFKPLPQNIKDYLFDKLLDDFNLE
ncbi:MAG: hypothetical protein ACPLW6_06105 [Desulfurella sp.]|uniref:Uncharacterized protein n=3 Tax=Desulfurella multipotens TaxID=79269 RepID=A0A1G6P5X1_9BACT|nr:hypothetical protein [Desulfurella multipotens]SDC75489.1 hypothetical protein SAMN05660835_01330 [Desulfurella multipotens]